MTNVRNRQPSRIGSRLSSKNAATRTGSRLRSFQYGEQMPPVVKNLMDSPPGETETFRPLLDLPGIRLEQIVSNGKASEEGFWYDQKEPE